ncbi:MAG TPA: EamA family transporter [Stenomitos sp.]
MPILQLVLATVFWGVLYSVGKMISPYLPPFALTLARYGMASLFLLPFAWREFRRIELADVPRLLIVGLLSSLFFNGLLFFGLRFAPAGDSVLAPAIVPILTTLLSMVFLGERPSGAKLTALAVSVVGVGLVFSSVLQAGGGSGRVTGDLLILSAGLSWSAYLLLSAPFSGRYSPLLLTSVTCLAGTVGSLPLAIWEGGLGRFAGLPGVAWQELLYVSLIGTVGAFTLWSQGSEAVGAERAAAYMNLVPLCGLVSSVVLLHEHLGVGQLIGMGLVLLGIWGATMASRAALRVIRLEGRASARL